MPTFTPLTKPLLFTLAIEELPLDQLPPEVASANKVVEPTHTCVTPVIGETVGRAVTVSNFETEPEHEPMVTV